MYDRGNPQLVSVWAPDWSSHRCQLGLLYGPKSGQRTRRMIREDANDALEAATEQIQESREQVNDMMEDAHARADRVITRAKRRAA